MLVADYMLARRGINRGSIITGKSTQPENRKTVEGCL